MKPIIGVIRNKRVIIKNTGVLSVGQQFQAYVYGDPDTKAVAATPEIALDKLGLVIDERREE